MTFIWRLGIFFKSSVINSFAFMVATEPLSPNSNLMWAFIKLKLMKDDVKKNALNKD